VHIEMEGLYEELNQLDEWEKTAITMNQFKAEEIAEKVPGFY
jgi:hypothetical protein